VLIGTIQQSSAWLTANDVLGLVVFVTAFARALGWMAGRALRRLGA
jgi:hypothetical protein